MINLLLAIIYLAFISLGLPDALLGSAWPMMHEELTVPVSYAGIISMIISVGTIASSLASDRMTRRFGTGKVTAFSVALTAAGLFGFSVSNSFWQLCLLAIPYGLGAGAIDAALNNYVALHYKARHMSWLHCFWGLGATLGPYVMGGCLTGGYSWNRGYQTIAMIQIVLSVLMFATLPLWSGGAGTDHEEGSNSQEQISFAGIIRLPGVKEVLFAFFCYCALEQTAGLWASSYMVMGRGISEEVSARWAAIFYLGITIGRFVSGFITMKLNDKNMIRLGQSIILMGLILMILPLGEMVLCIGLVLVGLGCAPIYPSIIHETPDNFGPGLSQAVIGMQMAFAYMGSTLMPPIFGMIAEQISANWYPVYLLVITIMMILLLERLNRVTQTGKQHE